MNRDMKPATAPKLLHLNVTSVEQQQQQPGPVDPLPVGPLTPEETQVLLQKLSINNPFYRFRKQSNSLKELRRKAGSDAPSVRSRSETDLGQVRGQQLLPHQQHSEAKVVVVLDSKQKEVAISRPRSSVSLKTRSVSSLSPSTNQMGDSSTVITNPFSIFHDDEILTLSVNTRLRSAANARSSRPQRQGRGLRRLFESNRSQNPPSEHHYLHGVPVRRFERQDFDNDSGDLLGRRTNTSSGKPKRSRAIFKQLSLRKLHNRAAAEDPPSLPKLKLSYPNRTHSIQSMRASGGGAYDIQHTTAYHPRLNHSTSPVTKANYFERLQAKTRQGIQKIRDKCRNFKTTTGDGGSLGGSEFSGFHTLAKDESFRFISDRANISSYESRCKQATIYKSYKSEIDLSKNLHYLDAYLEQNFDHQLSTTKQSAHSVGRVSGAQRKALAKQHDPAPETPRPPRHKRSQSQAANYGANYENLGTLPIASKSKVRNTALNSDSMSSSDYASVFSGPTTNRQEPEEDPKDFKLRYEHPDKMCEYYFDNLTSYALALEESEDLLLAESAKSARFFYDDDEEDDDDDEAGLAVDGLSAEDEAAGGRPDYMARDIRIRVKVNECEDADWHQPASATSYNENLAESTFYQSLNQHLQRQEVGDEVGLEEQNLLVGERGVGESYLEHFQRQRGRNYDRATSSAHYPRAEFYGFGRSAGEGGEQPDVARQRRADLMEAHYARSYQSGSRAKGRTRAHALEMERQHAAIPTAAATAMPAATGSVINLALPGQSSDVLYATSSKQQITMPTPTAGPQFHQPKPEPAALAAAGAVAATAIAAGTATAATPAGGATTLVAVSSAGNANNRYMLENLRKYYANQQQHPPAHSVNSSSLSNSSSSNSSMSQQQQQHLKLNLNLQPTAPKVQQQHLGNRRNSSTSNASSTADNFDTFITLRNATANTSTDYMAKQQQHRRGTQQQQQQQSVPLTSALNYYGHGATPTLNPALAYNGKLTATAMLSQVNLSRATVQPTAAATSSVAAATTVPLLLPHQQHSRSTSKGEGFILEYEC
ncbi:GD20870 [Drosophila simulans]|uniref:GD20870 n=1 Tax=Drosophila simulans TaxID=7240 RepID=B4QYK8_DROSI|nr:GD20870 [Drosophila simulans]